MNFGLRSLSFSAVPLSLFMTAAYYISSPSARNGDFVILYVIYSSGPHRAYPLIFYVHICSSQIVFLSNFRCVITAHTAKCFLMLSYPITPAILISIFRLFPYISLSGQVHSTKSVASSSAFLRRIFIRRTLRPLHQSVNLLSRHLSTQHQTVSQWWPIKMTYAFWTSIFMFLTDLLQQSYFSKLRWPHICGRSNDDKIHIGVYGLHVQRCIKVSTFECWSLLPAP